MLYSKIIKSHEYFIYLLFIYSLIDSREGVGREKERERNMDVREKHQLSACTHPSWGPNVQPRHMTGNQTGDLLVCRITPSQLSHAGQGDILFFKVIA